MFDAISSFGSGPSGLGQWGDLVTKVERDTLDLSQRIQPAYKGTFPDDDLGRQLVLVRAADQREPRDPRVRAPRSAGSTRTRTSPVATRR